MEMEKQMFEKQMFETMGDRVVDSDLGLAELPPHTKPVFFADVSGNRYIPETDPLSKFLYAVMGTVKVFS